MKAANNANRDSRAAAKQAARRENLRRMAGGDSPASIQRENSIFPAGFFKDAKISNLSKVVGR
jgi:hypothetical protein